MLGSIGDHAYISTHQAALDQWPIGSNQDKYQAAGAADIAFRTHGITACAFGSLACKLLGVNCKPNDVDLIALDMTSDVEAKKRLLVRFNPQFYLLPSQNPNATYRVLWYATLRGARVKVDILQPGVMSVPYFGPDKVAWIKKRFAGCSPPVAPLEVVLLLKLQGWDDHLQSNVAHRHEKHHTDVVHIYDLLRIGSYSGQLNFSYLPADFIQRAQDRVYSFVQAYPDSKDAWSSLGFRVVRPSRRRRRRAGF